MLKRRLRLRRDRDIRHVYHRGRAFPDSTAVLHVAKVTGPHSRCGFAAGKKLGGAVARNRVKRRLRHAMAELVGEIEPGHHLMIVARRGAWQASASELRAALKSLLRRAGVLAPDAGKAKAGCGA